MAYAEDFEKALQVGRPPNIASLFPNSKALIVSGKVIDRAMLAKGKAIAMAANGRNYLRHPRGAAGRTAGQRRAHHRDRQVRRRAEGLLRRELLEHGARSSMPSATNWASPSRSPSMPTTTASRTTRTWRRPRSRSRPCSRPASPPSPSTPPTCPTTRTCWPTSPSTRSSRSGPGSRPRSARSRAPGALHAGRGDVPHPGAQRPRHLPRLDRAEQRHHPRHRGVAAPASRSG